VFGVLAAAVTAVVLMAPGRTLAADAPRWVAAIFIDAQQAVGLRWNPVPGATGYKVLRGTTSGSGYAEIAASPQPQYFDKAVEAGTTYFYVLQAVAGAEVSANSAEKSVTIPGQKKQALAAPKWAKVVAQESTEFGKTSFKVGLIWNAAPGAIAYNVYRSATPGGEAQIITSASETQFTDTTVELGKTYYYTLSALDSSFQETARSPEEKVVIEKKADTTKKTKVKLVVKPRASKKLWAKVKGDENNAFDFWEPFDIEFSPATNRLFVTSNNTYQVIVLDAATGALVAKMGSEGVEPGQFKDPLGIGFDEDDNVVVADRVRKNLQVFSQDGKFIREIVPQVPGEYTAKFPAGPIPMDVAVDRKSGEYFISDVASKQVLVVDGKGKFLRVIGAAGTPGEMQSVTFLAFDPGGNLTVLDMVATKILTFKTDDGSLIRSWGLNRAAVDSFIFIGGFDYDAAGNIFVTDRSSSTIRGFLPDSRYLFNMANEKGDGPADVYIPKKVAIDRKKDIIFLVEGLVDRVQAYQLTGPIPSPQAELGEAE
jgi:DNA-binding beta-propeller fold protein YncE